MSTESQEPQGPNVDEVLADIESRGDMAWRLKLAAYASTVDAMLTEAHTLLNDGRIYDGSTGWHVLKEVADEISTACSQACGTASAMAEFADQSSSSS